MEGAPIFSGGGRISQRSALPRGHAIASVHLVPGETSLARREATPLGASFVCNVYARAKRAKRAPHFEEERERATFPGGGGGGGARSAQGRALPSRLRLFPPFVRVRRSRPRATWLPAVQVHARGPLRRPLAPESLFTASQARLTLSLSLALRLSPFLAAQKKRSSPGEQVATGTAAAT